MDRKVVAREDYIGHRENSSRQGCKCLMNYISYWGRYVARLEMNNRKRYAARLIDFNMLELKRHQWGDGEL